MDVNTPNPKTHLYISIAKSVIRIAAGVSLVVGNVWLCGCLLIAAEILGIAEEIF